MGDGFKKEFALSPANIKMSEILSQMSAQEIGLIVVGSVIALYVIAALLFRSKSRDVVAEDIILEARLPQSGVSKELLQLESDTEAPKTRNRRRRRKSNVADATTGTAATKKDSTEKRTQKHHASPKPVAKATPEAKPKRKAKPVSKGTAPASKSKPDPQAKAVEPAQQVAAQPMAEAVAQHPEPKPEPVAKIEPEAKPEPVVEAKPEPEIEEIDPKLTGQISEVDDRLDAIEKLVTSIEESLATFDDPEDAESGQKSAAA